jgi:Zn-dependent M28 family amino/carboxypeptidase
MKAAQERIRRDLQFLTSLQPYRNYRHPESLKRVCEYLQSAFSAMGLETEEQIWEVGGTSYKNIVASYNKDAKRRLIVGAHYDVCGDQPGADDNASGIAGLLESARLIAGNKPKLSYQVDFVAYCLEEPPFFATAEMGSYIHARSLHDQKIDVIGMICYEMIGYFSNEAESQPFPTPAMAARYPHVANFIVVVGIEKYRNFNDQVQQLMSAGSEIDVQVISFPEAQGLAGLSDHRNYWSFNYKALMINDTAFIRNPNYHKITDTLDTLDMEKISHVVDSTYQAITGF